MITRTSNNGKKNPGPVECTSLDEVRSNIDRLDTVIVRLLAERSTFVAQAAGFKVTEDDVVVPERIEAIIKKVRGYADLHGANPDLIEAIYRRMIDAFIDFERNAWQDIHSVRG